MRAIILAAGRGVRMRPLTDYRPKPLLEVNGKPIILYHIENLVNAGIRNIVINHAIMGEQIENLLGNGRRLGAEIVYSAEGDLPLETGGGIFRALPFLGTDPFLALNGDIWTDYSFQDLPKTLAGLAHLILVNNPEHNKNGDFALLNNYAKNHGQARYTFSGIGVYSRDLFKECTDGIFSLTPLLRRAAEQDLVTAKLYHGFWMDIGTPERLDELTNIVNK